MPEDAVLERPAKAFKDLHVYTRSRELAKCVYTETKRAVFKADYSLASQLQRNVVSIMSNIAEGFERGGNIEFNSSSTLPKDHAES